MEDNKTKPYFTYPAILRPSLIVCLILLLLFFALRYSSENSTVRLVHSYNGLVIYDYNGESYRFVNVIEKITGKLNGWKDITHVSVCNDAIDKQAIKKILKTRGISTINLVGRFIEDESFEDIDGSAALEELRVYSSLITDKGLKYISTNKSITNLLVSSEGITNKGVSYISSMKKLRVLSIHSSQINDDVVVDLILKMPSLEKIHLGNTNISDKFLEKISAKKTFFLSALVTLKLHNMASINL